MLAGRLLFFVRICTVHAVISTWLISNVGHELVFKAWKEAFLIAVLLPLSIVLLWRQRTNLFTQAANTLIIAFIALNILLALVVTSGAKAE
ncbi:MAG: hypothetical protein U0491_01955 [Candidatus Saccharimonadales bacterium]